MKKSYYFLAGMALLGLMTGCSNELDEPGANPNGDAVRIMFEAPEALQVTRAVTGTNSAQGGLTNVDWSKYDLRYQVAVYSEDGATLLVAPQTQVVDTYGPVSFEYRLTPNNTYVGSRLSHYRRRATCHTFQFGDVERNSPCRYKRLYNQYTRTKELSHYDFGKSVDCGRNDRCRYSGRFQERMD